MRSHLSALIAALAVAAAVAGAIAGRLAGGPGPASRLAVGAGVGALLVLGLRAGLRAFVAASDPDDELAVAPRLSSDDALLMRAGPIVVGISMVLGLLVPPVAPAARAAPAAALAAARVDAAAKAYATAVAEWKAGRAGVDVVYVWSLRWLGAVRDRPTRGRAWGQALAEHEVRMRAVEAEAVARRDAGTGTAADVEAAGYYRVEAELWVARGKM